MEHGAKECVEEQSRRATAIAVGVQSAAYIDTEITATNTKEEPGLVELVKSEAGLLVKEEVVEDGWRDMDRQPCLQGTYTPAITTSMNVVAGGVVQDDMKEEWADTDMDVGPTVLQHMDAPYKPVQPDVSIIKQEGRSKDNNINPTLCSGVKVETIEDERRADTDAQRSNNAAQSEQQAQSQLYSCDKCAKTYASKGSLMEHFRNLHSVESLKCHKCNKKFPSKSYLYSHTSYSHSEQQYECAVCEKICKSKAALRKHVHRVHQPRPAVTSPVVHTCEYCHKTYTTKQGLIYHIDVVHTKVRYKCSGCNEEYKSKHLLQGHIKKEHEGSETHFYICDYCKKMFTEKVYVRRHIGVEHHLSGSYKCYQCNKIFKCKEYLMKHKTRMHTAGLQIHKCEYCQKTFRYKSGLKRHTESIHVAAHIHRCRRCDMNFKCNDELQQHNTSIHGKPQYKCQVCLKVYKTIYNLGRHFKKAHNSKDIQFQSDFRRHEMLDSRPTADVTNAAASTSKQQHNVDVVKEEPADAELELGPVVFQHMDCNYRPYKLEPQLD